MTSMRFIRHLQAFDNVCAPGHTLRRDVSISQPYYTSTAAAEFEMEIARLWCVPALLCPCLTACGGGGGGSDNRPPSISFSTSAITFQVESVYSILPPSQTITATLAGKPPQNSTLFILIEVANPDIVSVTNAGPTSDSTGQATLVPGDNHKLGAGEHSTTIVVHTCFNSPTCANGEISGSPKTITVTYNVPSSVRGDNVSPNVVPANAPGEVI